MSFDSLYCISTRAARGGEGCLGGWRDVEVRREVRRQGERLSAAATPARANKSSRASQARQGLLGLPGPPQAWYLLIILERNSWVDVNWTFFTQFVIFLVLQIAKQLCFSCARFWSLRLGLRFGLQNSCASCALFCALVCAFACAGFWSLWLGLCSRLAKQLCYYCVFFVL